MATERTLAPGEELANSITHGLGLALSLLAAPVLIVSAAATADRWRIIAASIYGTTLVLMYLASTVYHALRAGRAKAVLRRIDHAASYLLIAGP